MHRKLRESISHRLISIWSLFSMTFRTLTFQSRLAVLVPKVDSPITASSGKGTLNRMKLNIIDAIDLRRLAIGSMAFERKVGSV